MVRRPSDGRCVLWFNGCPRLWEGRFGVAVSDAPGGPFEVVREAVGVSRPTPGTATPRWARTAPGGSSTPRSPTGAGGLLVPAQPTDVAPPPGGVLLSMADRRGSTADGIKDHDLQHWEPLRLDAHGVPQRLRNLRQASW